MNIFLVLFSFCWIGIAYIDSFRSVRSRQKFSFSLYAKKTKYFFYPPNNPSKPLQPNNFTIAWRECRELYFLEQDLLAHNIPYTFVNVDDFLYYEQIIRNINSTQLEQKRKPLTNLTLTIPCVLLNGKLVGDTWFDIYEHLFRDIF